MEDLTNGRPTHDFGSDEDKFNEVDIEDTFCSGPELDNKHEQ